MNPQTAEALATGPTRLEEPAPYWMSAQIRKMAIVVVPLPLLLLSIGRTLPGIYAWRMRSRVHRHYRDLLSVETELHREDLSAKDAGTLAHQLDGIDSAAEWLNLPLRYRETAFALRMHVWIWCANGYSNGWGQRDRYLIPQISAGALENPHIQRRLHLRDPRRSDCRVNPQITPRSGHSAQRIDTDKSADVVDIGHSSRIFDTAWQYAGIPNRSGIGWVASVRPHTR